MEIKRSAQNCILIVNGGKYISTKTERSAQNCILIVNGGKYISTKTENYCRQLENMPVSPLASCTGLRVLEYSHILLEVGPI